MYPLFSNISLGVHVHNSCSSHFSCPSVHCHPVTFMVMFVSEGIWHCSCMHNSPWAHNFPLHVSTHTSFMHFCVGVHSHFFAVVHFGLHLLFAHSSFGVQQVCPHGFVSLLSGNRGHVSVVLIPVSKDMARIGVATTAPVICCWQFGLHAPCWHFSFGPQQVVPHCVVFLSPGSSGHPFFMHLPCMHSSVFSQHLSLHLVVSFMHFFRHLLSMHSSVSVHSLCPHFFIETHIPLSHFSPDMQHEFLHTIVSIGHCSSHFVVRHVLSIVIRVIFALGGFSGKDFVS